MNSIWMLSKGRYKISGKKFHLEFHYSIYRKLEIWPFSEFYDWYKIDCFITLFSHIFDRQNGIISKAKEFFFLRRNIFLYVRQNSEKATTNTTRDYKTSNGDRIHKTSIEIGATGMRPISRQLHHKPNPKIVGIRFDKFMIAFCMLHLHSFQSMQRTILPINKSKTGSVAEMLKNNC